MRRLDPFAKVKDHCDKCNQTGWDYVISESLEDESFNSGLLEYPQYTRPATYCNKDVPSVLLSGNHRHITEWRDCKRLEKTLLNRPDLLSAGRVRRGR